jgi:hypothetical protein
MTTRAWWLVILNFLLPGSAQVLAGNKRLGKFGLGATLTGWAVIALGILLGLFWTQAFLFLGTWGPTLFLGQIALYFY